jgi:hypothetical protein
MTKIKRKLRYLQIPPRHLKNIIAELIFLLEISRHGIFCHICITYASGGQNHHPKESGRKTSFSLETTDTQFHN